MVEAGRTFISVARLLVLPLYTGQVGSQGVQAAVALHHVRLHLVAQRCGRGVVEELAVRLGVGALGIAVGAVDKLADLQSSCSVNVL